MTPRSWDSWLPNWSDFRPLNLHLLVGWEGSTHKVQVRRVPVSAHVASDLLTPVVSTLDYLKVGVAIQYSPETELRDLEYGVVSREQLDLESSIIRGVESILPAEIETTEWEKPLLFYALVVGEPNQRLIFVRRSNPRANVTKRYFTMFEDVLSKIEKPILSFDLDVMDLVLVQNGGLVVINPKVHERLFEDSPEVTAKIGNKVRELHSVIPLTDDSLASLERVALKNSRARSRISSILSRGHLSGLPLANIRKAMKRHNIDPNKHIKSGKIHFEDEEVMAIIQLLNEDLSFGELSAQEFVINKKSPR